MNDILSSGKACTGRYVLFIHIHPTKEDHMDLMIEDSANENLLCYNHPKAFTIFPSESEWTFYGLKDLNYLKHSGEIRPGFGSLNPVETGLFEITQDPLDNNIFTLKTQSHIRKFKISYNAGSVVFEIRNQDRARRGEASNK